MIKETYRVRTPKNIIIGDPWYFEKYEGEKLDKLIANINPRQGFLTMIVLEEKPLEDCPEITDRSMTIYCSYRGMVPVFLQGQRFPSHTEESRPLNVDSAHYVIKVDDREINVCTGGDGCWGYHNELYAYSAGRKRLDGTITNIGFSENFEDMQQIRDYMKTLFENVEQVENFDIVESDTQTQEQKM